MYSFFLKRLIDFIVVFGVLVIIWPILLIMTLWLHFANRGAGAFFTQERPGQYGKIFKVIKFKTMTDERDENGDLLPDEKRLTKIGKFIRSTSVDELPQLWNVFCGDMAFIGPRPERQFFIDQIMKEDPRYRFLFQIRPGVTSYATLYNGYTDTLEKMVRRLRYDLFYLEHRSWGFDFKILFMTFMSIVFGKKF